MIRMSKSQKDCKIPAAKCMDDANISAYNQILETSKTNPILGAMLPFSESEIKIAQKALSQYKKDCEKCAGGARNDIDCLEAAKVNFNRNMPSSYKDVYPWRNYDWDYSNFIANQYSTKALPPGDPNKLSGILKNAKNITKTLDGFIFDPAPNALSNPYSSDRNSDYPVDGCKNNPICSTTESIKRVKQDRPTNDSFIKKFPISGENSSSYYYKVGVCPRPDIKNITDCEKRGYKWTPSSINEGGGSCAQPRYMYIDNTAKPFFNGSEGKGIIPSIANDIRDIMPDRLFNSLLGQSTAGLQIDTCPIVEGFINNDNITEKMGVIILLGLIMIYISKKLK